MRICLCGLVLALLAGCAGTRPYPEDIAAKNLSVRTASSGARAALGIHSVDAQCRTQYLGTVALDKPTVTLGIPAERWSYLVFDFATSRYLGSQRGRISRETLLKPRAGYRYEVDVTYRDDLYDVVIREQPPRGKPRELMFLDLGSCAK